MACHACQNICTICLRLTVAVDRCTSICLQLQLTIALYVCSCSWHLQLTLALAFDTVADAFDVCVWRLNVLAGMARHRRGSRGALAGGARHSWRSFVRRITYFYIVDAIPLQ